LVIGLCHPLIITPFLLIFDLIAENLFYIRIKENETQSQDPYSRNECNP